MTFTPRLMKTVTICYPLFHGREHGQLNDSLICDRGIYEMFYENNKHYIIVIFRAVVVVVIAVVVVRFNPSI